MIFQYYLCNIYLYFYKWYAYFFFLLSSFRDFPNWKRFENTSLRALTQKTFQWNAVLKSKSLNFLPVFSNQSLMLSNMLAKGVICLCCVSISSSSSKVRLNNRIPKKSKRLWTFSSRPFLTQKRQFRLRRTRGTRGTSAFRILRCGSPLFFFCSDFPGHSKKDSQRTPPKKIGTNTLLQVFEKTSLEKTRLFFGNFFG